MDNNEKDAWMNNLPSNIRSIVKNFSDYAKIKIKEKIDAGYKVSEANSGEIEVVKGYSYYGITSGGTMYAK
jgi:hypothetical protein